MLVEKLCEPADRRHGVPSGVLHDFSSAEAMMK